MKSTFTKPSRTCKLNITLSGSFMSTGIITKCTWKVELHVVDRNRFHSGEINLSGYTFRKTWLERESCTAHLLSTAFICAYIQEFDFSWHPGKGFLLRHVRYHHGIAKDAVFTFRRKNRDKVLQGFSCCSINHTNL